jgi:hypothetical protein
MFNVDQARLTTLAGTGSAAGTITVAEYSSSPIRPARGAANRECRARRTASEALVREWLAGYVALLASRVADADRPAAALDAIPPATRARLDGEWQGPSLAAAPPATVHEWILRTAAASPTAIAVRDAAGTLTYAALVAQARALVKAPARGVRPAPRRLWSRGRVAPVALLATPARRRDLTCRSTPSIRARVRFMLEDAAPRAGSSRARPRVARVPSVSTSLRSRPARRRGRSLDARRRDIHT